jgi:hypothetical protein
VGDEAALTKMLLSQPLLAKSQFLREGGFGIVGLADVEGALLTSLPKVEVPVRTSSRSGLGISTVLELQDAAAVVAALHYGALGEPISSAIYGLPNTL